MACLFCDDNFKAPNNIPSFKKRATANDNTQTIPVIIKSYVERYCLNNDLVS